MKENVLKVKSYQFALMVIKVYKQMVAAHKEFVLSKQFLKAGTSPGAMIHEAEYAQSKPDFISKLTIGLKEVNECEYWTSLLKDSEYITAEIETELTAAINDIKYLMVSSIKTAKTNLR